MSAGLAAVRALYLHVPFCERKCPYCDFASWATRRADPLMGAYATALERQAEALAEAGMLGACETAYVGGGTPSLLGVGALAHLVRSLRAVAPAVGELTCEANPESLSDEVIASLAAAGATRVSMGVQSLNDRELEALGRVHDARTALGRIRAAALSGMDVSCDLMCAVPGQGEGSWALTLGRLAATGVGHVSVYPLQIEEGTPLAAAAGDDPAWNDPEVQARRMEQAASVLGAAGYRRYEVASYALPGKECRHNQAYWTGLPYLGLGTGASSMLPHDAYLRLRSLCPQLPAIGAGVLRVRMTVTSGRHALADDPALERLSFSLEFLSEGQALAEDLMLALRRTEGAPEGLVRRASEALGEGRVGDALDEGVRRGLAAWREGCLVPTHDGWLYGNELYGLIWGLAEGPVSTARC